MNMVLKIIVSIAGSLAALVAIGWLGLQIPSKVVTPVTEKAQTLGGVPIPEQLPAPVLRYLQAALGKHAPRIESAVFWGRAQANFGLWVPMRFQLYHRVGYDFRRAMQITWFGLPVLKALDQYINGQGMTGLVGKADTGERVDQGSNMILFAEAPLYPSIFVTDARIRWVAIDDTSAQLFFPFGAAEDTMTVYFDPQTDLITKMTALRYFGANGEKEAWRVDFLSWQVMDGMIIPALSAITWEKQGKPWSYWEITGVTWNVDLAAVLTPTLATQPEKVIQ